MMTPTDWLEPTFLMNFPLSVSNKSPNNVLMSPSLQGNYDKAKASQQWSNLYRYLADAGLVYVLPGHDDLQDLPFVANIGCQLPHLDNVILLSKFTSKVRTGEEAVGRRFFKSFHYQLVQSPYCWEGEADLKWVRSNVYVGGTGIRSTREAYQWMEQTFDMEVIQVELTDQKLYHLDCVFFPLTETKAIVNTKVIDRKSVRKLEAFVEIIDVPTDYIYQGWTNVVRIGNIVLHAPAALPWRPFKDLLAQHNFHLEVFDLSEFDKSGADLSCLVMHLNHRNRL